MVLQYITFHYITLHYIALHCTALHCTALHSIALHCIAFALHCVALHLYCICIALHCICIALRCIVLCMVDGGDEVTCPIRTGCLNDYVSLSNCPGQQHVRMTYSAECEKYARSTPFVPLRGTTT